MRKVCLSKRPDFPLMKQDAVLSFRYMQMPVWLFTEPQFQGMSLETKVAYMFLLNRFQLSQVNQWTNEEGEVFIVYPREKLAGEIGISYRKAIACFKELLTAGLIWEYRGGRGNANHIYLATMPVISGQASDIMEIPERHDGNEMPSAEIIPSLDLQNQHVLNCVNGISESANPAFPDMPFSHPNYLEENKQESNNHNYVSQSGRLDSYQTAWQQGDEHEVLFDILKNSELDVLPRNEAAVFQDAVTRLYYSEGYRVGNSLLPQYVIRSRLSQLKGSILLDTREKIRANKTKQVRNSTAYIMTCLLNNICEYHSDIMVDPVLNSM